MTATAQSEPAVEAKKTCFVIMPITTRDLECYEKDPNHFVNVYEGLFRPAIESLGMDALPPSVKGTKFIQGDIIKNLLNADMVLCDMSALNPNVFLELGIRIAAGKPMCLVVDDATSPEALPFDLKPLSHHRYSARGNWGVIDAERSKIAEHVRTTMADPKLGKQLWQQWSLQAAIDQPVKMEKVGHREEEDYLLGQLRELISGSRAILTDPDDDLDDLDDDLDSFEDLTTRPIEQVAMSLRSVIASSEEATAFLRILLTEVANSPSGTTGEIHATSLPSRISKLILFYLSTVGIIFQIIHKSARPDVPTLYRTRVSQHSRRAARRLIKLIDLYPAQTQTLPDPLAPAPSGICKASQ